MKRTALLMGVLLLPLLLAGRRAAADVIHLKSGGKVEGTIVSKTEAEVVVQTGAGKVTLKASDIAKIEQKATPFDLYREMAAKVAGDDADGHFALGLWCADHKLNREARLEFEKAIALQPNHKGAREKLGYVLKDGNWLTHAEAKKADGFVRHEGKWVSEDERDKAEQREATLAWLRRFRQVVAKRPTTEEAVAARLRETLGNRPRDLANVALRALLEEMVKEAAEAKRDTTAEARLAVAGLVADQNAPEATDLLRRVAVRDVDGKVRGLAIKTLAAQKDVENTAYLVGLLHRFTSPRVRLQGDKPLRATARRVLRRAAEALGGLGDPRAIPALANTLIVRFRINESTDEMPPMQMGFSSTSLVGTETYTDPYGNQLAVPITEGMNWGLDQSERETEDPFFFNDSAYNALRALSKQDFSHDQRAWLAWWYRNRHQFED